MFWFSFLFAETLCAQNELAILLGSRHTISISMCRAHFYLLIFFDPFTYLKSHFSPLTIPIILCVLLNYISICIQAQYSYHFVHIFKKYVSVVFCYIYHSLLTSFSSQDYEILRWLQADTSKYGPQYSPCLLNVLIICIEHILPTLLLINCWVFQIFAITSNSMEIYLHMFLWGPGQEFPWAQRPGVLGLRIHLYSVLLNTSKVLFRKITPFTCPWGFPFSFTFGSSWYHTTS